jgi:hypothetical protein
MTLLDRFRAQSRNKHADPAVRLAYVAEIPLEERQLIGEIARGDDDARVRLAAVAKLLDPAVLGAIARDDASENVRTGAVSMLRDIALDVFEDTTESDALEAVDAISDVRLLAQIAKTSAREIVALRALSRAGDARLLGSVARHGRLEPARQAAFERLRERGDRAEILAVAMNSEFSDTALAALEAVVDRSELEQIAASGRNRSAVKRARAVIREADERAAAEAAAVAEALSAPPADPAHEAAAGEQGMAAADAERLRAGAAEERERQAEAARQLEAAERQRQELAAARAREAEARAAARAREAEDAAQRQAADRARLAEAQEADARARREGLARMHNLLGRVEPLVGKEDLTLKAAERALRDLRTALEAVPAMPTPADSDEVIRRLHAAQSALTPKVQDLREADEWRRWANVTVQEELCAAMEALRAVEDPEIIVREVRALQERWRQAADVPRTQADRLWRRFKTAHDEAWTRCEAHFAAQAQARAENLAKKRTLCERVEALADSSDWIRTADAIKQLQVEWKSIGPVSRGREKAIWDRFRAACDRFFARRHEDLARRKTVWSENLARKDALCARAEALADSTDWEPAAAEIRRLQSEWKTVGPVKRSRSEAVWRRFHGACERFFTRYAQRHDLARAERVAAREAICAELDALAAETVPDAPQEPPPTLPAAVRTLRERWQQEHAARGVDADSARALDQRFAESLTRVLSRWPAAFAGSDLDPEANRRRMESLVQHIETLAVSVAGPAAAAAVSGAGTPATRLAEMLKEALAANTIGGKVDDSVRVRAAVEDVRQAQASWSRIGLVPEEARRALADRFQRACRQIMEKAGQAGRPAGSTAAASRPRGNPRR